MPQLNYTFCHICTQLCGLAITVGDNGKIEKVRPDKDNPYSWRDFCIKGATCHEILDHPRRIRTPLKRQGDRYVEATYEEAIADVASRLKMIVERCGPDAVGSYAGNPAASLFGSILFQDLLMTGIGSHNRFWVGSVDTNTVHVVCDEMYGSEWAVQQTDIDDCRFMIFIGADPAISGMNWLDQFPDGWKRALAAKEKGAQLVVIDPRRSDSAAKATQHIAPLPETDWALLLGMIKVIFENGLENKDHCARANGTDSLRQIAGACELSDLSRRCDVPVETIVNLAKGFAASETGMVVSRTGPGLGGNGTLSFWLSQCLNIITGRLDSPGGLYYMPGLLDLMRDAGTIFPTKKIPSRVRELDSVAGYHHLAELSDEIMTPGRGQIKALIINGGNPVVSGPDGDALDEALKQLDLLVCVDLFQRESHRHADWLIPGVHFLEREELNPLVQSLHNSLFVQASRQVVQKPSTIRYEWEFFRDVGLAMNLPLAGKRWLNPLIRLSRGLGRIMGNPYYSFSPRFVAWDLVRKHGSVPWKDIMTAPHGIALEREKFGNFWKNIHTSDGKANLCPERFLAALQQKLQEPIERSEIYPLQLISRRRKEIMNSWLVETSGQRLQTVTGCLIEVNSEDCAALGLTNGEEAQVVSATGRVTGRVQMSNKIRPGVAVMGHGWGSRLYSPKDNEEPIVAGVNRNRLVSNTDLDPFSGVPRLNGTPINIVPVKDSQKE
ncbi:MAG: molybdopterin-dependent oxidoreductase [Syntrophobacteraceae bacterium]